MGDRLFQNNRHFQMPLEHYEDIWEDYMEYTDFKDVSEVNTIEEVYSWFGQQDRHSKVKRFTSKKGGLLRSRMKEALASLKDKKLFKEAGGKDLEQDRRQTANVVPASEYHDTQHQDLRGLDTKGAGRGYTVRGSIKSKGQSRITYARLTTIKGKPAYRDSRGRFVKVKR